MTSFSAALKNKTARAGLLTAVGSAVARGSGLVATLWAAAVMPAAEFAGMAFIISTGAVIGTLGALGLPRGIARMLAMREAEDEAWARRVWRVSVTVAVSVTAAVSVVAAASAAEAWSPLHRIPPPGLLAVGLIALGWITSQLGTSRMVVASRFRSVASFTVLRAVAMAAAIVVPAAMGADGVTVALVLGGADAVTGVVMMCVVRFQGPLDDGPPFPLRVGPMLVRNGLPAWIGELSATAYTWFGLWMFLGPLDSPELAAAFSVGQRLYFAVLLISNQLMAAAVPEMTRQISTGRIQEARGTLSSLTLVSFVACIVPGLMVLAVLALGGGRLLIEDSGTTWLVIVMVAVSLLSSVGNIYGVVLQAAGSLWKWTTADVMLSAVFVPIAILGMLVGAAAIGFAFVAAHSARTVIVVLGARKVMARA